MSEATPIILNKIKLLLKLTASPNAHEAETARGMADKLIAKYNVTEAQLAGLDDPRPLYGDEEKVYSTIGLVGWKQYLVLAIANYFECQIVVEELAGAEGEHQFSYFAYGDDDQVKNIQFVYSAFSKKIDDLVRLRCIGRGPIFIDSYCEGVVESIRNNIQMDGIDIPEVKRHLSKEQEDNSQTDKLSTVKESKASPTDNKASVSKGSLIKDVMAYFKGLDDGKFISLKDVLELEVENEGSNELPNV